MELNLCLVVHVRTVTNRRSVLCFNLYMCQEQHGPEVYSYITHELCDLNGVLPELVVLLPGYFLLMFNILKPERLCKPILRRGFTC